MQRGWAVVMPSRRGRGGSEGEYDEGFAIDRSRGYTCDPPLSIPGADRALRDIEALHKDAANTLAELDVLVSTKLQAQRISNPSSRPKVAVWNWVRQAKQLEQFRMQMHRIINSLSAALTALNGMHLASLRA